MLRKKTNKKELLHTESAKTRNSEHLYFLNLFSVFQVLVIVLVLFSNLIEVNAMSVNYTGISS